MVLFDNVCKGQRVDVRWDDGIYKGTVRYKGPVTTKNGDWVGIELDHAGRSNNQSDNLCVKVH